MIVPTIDVGGGADLVAQGIAVRGLGAPIQKMGGGTVTIVSGSFDPPLARELCP